MTESAQQNGHRLGDAIEISGDYQARALHSDRAAQRFWHEAKFRLIERIGLPTKAERVLDAGCGSGTISDFLSRYAGQVVASDSNPAAITYATKTFQAPNLQFKLGQFSDLKNEQPFNRIYCIEVIEHLYEHQVTEILSLFRALAGPGASLLITTPNYRSLWPVIERLLDAFGLVAKLDEAQHVTHLTKSKLVTICEKAGWTVEKIGTFNGFAPFIAPMSHRLALMTEQLEFRFNNVLPQNLLFCLCMNLGGG
ncbi:MAG TPA: class I SAM-dependent methyltransferase [Chthoniobacterales bacterium]|nr:class I SAM-dependent methyltransferase [Chthoniobacterales bacterium]